MRNKPQPTPEQRLGAALRDLRQQHALSQQGLADAMGELGFSWRQTTVAKTESADRPVPAGELVALTKVFGVPVDHLLGEAPDQEVARAFRNMLRTRGRLMEASQAKYDAEAAQQEARGKYQKAEQLHEKLQGEREEAARAQRPEAP